MLDLVRHLARRITEHALHDVRILQARRTAETRPRHHVRFPGRETNRRPRFINRQTDWLNGTDPINYWPDRNTAHTGTTDADKCAPNAMHFGRWNAAGQSQYSPYA